MKKLFNSIALAIAMLGVLLALPLSAKAATISQGFSTEKPLIAGSVVSLQKDSLVLATTQNLDGLLGVVVTARDYLINIDATKTAQVVTSGAATALASDINGDISIGDKLTASPISGVAMKATDSGKILGIAREALNKSSTQVTQTVDVKDKHGQTRQVHIGTIQSEINVVDYQFSGGTNSSFVAGIQSVASNAAGKQVSPLKAVLAFLVLALALIISVIVLYSSVSSSIRSIGRNPLSKRFVVQGLVQVVIAVFIIMIAAFSVVYIIIGS